MLYLAICKKDCCNRIVQGNLCENCRSSGCYTRIIKTGHRLGDNAEMCFIELVDYNENMAKEKVAKKATRTRVRKKPLQRLLLLLKFLQLKNLRLNRQNNLVIVLIDIEKVALKKVTFFVFNSKDTLINSFTEHSDWIFCYICREIWQNL